MHPRRELRPSGWRAS
ncbi:unnamed protein product, partial [Didymodactylos carnosus]